MKILITGANGFVGKFLVQSLLERGHEVFSGVRNKSEEIPLKVRRCYFNVIDLNEIKTVLIETKPDVIFHLAAQSNVPVSWNNPAETIHINTIGTINLMTSASQVVPKAKIITVGSSEEYGISAKYNEYLNETLECLPQNPYASSKLAAGQITLQLAKKYNIKAIHVRPFNHFGPGQKKGFVISDFASQIAEIEANIIEPIIKVGNLDTWRDFTDVRDIINAYVLLIEKDVDSGIYNVSSDIKRRIGDILNQLIKLSTKPINIVVDSNKFRPAEVKQFAGNSSKLKEVVEWSPEHDFVESLKDTLDWWRSKVNKELTLPIKSYF